MFSKTCKYGIRATLYIASEASKEGKVGTDEISEALNVPRHFLAKILQQLTKAELITSVKGPHGGFYISERNMEKSLYDIVETLDGGEVFQSCILGLPVCSSENPCPLHVQAFAYREGLVYQIKHQSIRDLVKRIEVQNLNI